MLTLTLSPQQKAELKTYIANPLADLPAKRLQIVAMADRGLTVTEIAGYVTLHPLHVRKWLNRYRRAGLDGLRNIGKSTGRPLIFDAQQRAEIKRLYATQPRQMGLPFTRWSLKRMKAYLVDQGLVTTISEETVRKVLGGDA